MRELNYKAAFIFSLIAFIVWTVFCVIANARYEAELTPAAKAALANVYLEPIDPCDTIYRLIIPASDEWKAKYFDSERSRLIHNIGELNVAVIKATALLQGHEKRIAALEAKVVLPYSDVVLPDSNDPNGVKE
jgi:hypothetical protein